VLLGQDTFNPNPRGTHMPKRARDRRTPLAQLQARLDSVTGDSACTAWIAPQIGLLMPCTRPCGRRRELRAEVERLRPEWQAEREQYLAEHPEAKPRRVVLDADEETDEL
jgi:hypothetical protein